MFLLERNSRDGALEEEKRGPQNPRSPRSQNWPTDVLEDSCFGPTRAIRFKRKRRTYADVSYWPLDMDIWGD